MLKLSLYTRTSPPAGGIIVLPAASPRQGIFCSLPRAPSFSPTQALFVDQCLISLGASRRKYVWRKTPCARVLRDH